MVDKQLKKLFLGRQKMIMTPLQASNNSGSNDKKDPLQYRGGSGSTTHEYAILQGRWQIRQKMRKISMF